MQTTGYTQVEEGQITVHQKTTIYRERVMGVWQYVNSTQIAGSEHEPVDLEWAKSISYT